MKYKKSVVMLVLGVFLFCIAGVCASNVNDVAIACEDVGQIELSASNEMDVDNLQTDEQNEILVQMDDDESISVGKDSKILSEDIGNYSELSVEISREGNIELEHKYYEYDSGSTIEITGDNRIIDGKGAIIDMAGSTNMCAFKVTASGVLIKNLTIKNANYNDDYGGAIYFSESGIVSDCNFINNTAFGGAGAVYINSNGNVVNCNFTGNTANGNNHDYDGGGAVWMFSGNVTGCNFINNSASRNGGAVRMNSGNVKNCNFTNNTVTGIDSSYGAVYIVNGNVTVCNFINNSGSKRGGAVYINSNGNVVKCNFIDNTASENGGAVWLSSGDVVNCNFKGNIAILNGGAVFIINGNVAGCNFINNSASRSGGAVYVNTKGNVENCNFTCNTANGDKYNDGGAAVNMRNGNLVNCNFIDNTASRSGGAVNIFNGNVTSCNFINNSFKSNNSTCGGGVWLSSGNVVNCNFINNSAKYGGAVYINSNGNVTSCNFMDNTASQQGGAIRLNSGNVTMCNFAGNSAPNGGAIFTQMGQHSTADTCIFKINDLDTTDINTLILPPTLNVDNFTTFYNSGDKLTFDLRTNSSLSVTNGNISISVYFKNNNSWVGNYSCLSGEGWTVDLPVGSFYAIFNTEYAEFKPINRTITIKMPNVKYYINVTSLTTNNRTVNITANSNIPKNILYDGKLLFILNYTTEISANYSSNGTWWAVHTFEDCGEYNVGASYIGLENVAVNNATLNITKVNSTITIDNLVFVYGDSINVKTEGSIAITAKIDGVDVSVVDNFIIPLLGLNVGTYNLTIVTIPDKDHTPVAMNATITINPLPTELIGNDIIAMYNVNRDLIITLKDARGNVLSGVSVTVDLKGAKTYITDKNGQVKVSTKGLVPNIYAAKVAFNGNGNYIKSALNVKVTVKKATPKLTAKKKTFKKSKKIKKYTIVLKDNLGKAIKKAKVSIKIGKKKYNAKTNAKGKAIFKIKKLIKKGTYKATVTFKGNAYYNKVIKKVKIKLK